MVRGYFPNGEVSRAKRQLTVDILKNQLQAAVLLRYRKIYERYSELIVEAEIDFKRDVRANAKELGEKGLVGEAGKAAQKSLEQMAGKPRAYFCEGVDSIRGGAFVQGQGPAFGVPVRD